jgi:hypothetical protein
MSRARPALILLLLTTSCADANDPNEATAPPKSQAQPQPPVPAPPAPKVPAPSAPPATSASPGEPPVNELAAAMAAFRKRVDGYLELRDQVADDYPEVKETGDPKKISMREQALGQAIGRARQSAKAGDVFGPDMSPHLARIVAEDWESRSPADRKALLGELPPGLELKVNQAYPTTLPLVSVPAKLLARLPMLPEALEYRLLDRRLLLRDRDANVVVDVLVGVLPQR